MPSPDRYASILNTLLEIAKERGASGSDAGVLAYEIIEAAKAEAKIWGVPLDEIGLAGFDASTLLSGPRKAA